MIKTNDGKHIETVVNRTSCKTHRVESGTPCWTVSPISRPGSVAPAVCGIRIKAAGYVGEISETSVQSKKKAAHKKEVGE